MAMIAALAALTAITGMGKYAVQPESERFVWSICKRETALTIVGTADRPRDYSKMSRTDLDLILVPQHQDPRLLESTFIVRSANMGGGNAPPLYQGPFHPRLTIESVPHRRAQRLARLESKARFGDRRSPSHYRGMAGSGRMPGGCSLSS